MTVLDRGDFVVYGLRCITTSRTPWLPDKTMEGMMHIGAIYFVMAVLQCHDHGAKSGNDNVKRHL